MKRIGIISDSHGSTAAVEKALKALGPIELLVHLGDGAGDADGLGVPVIQLKGNCDHGCDAPLETVITLDKGLKVLCCQGDRWGVKWGTDRIVYHAMEEEVHAVCFGHTHSALERTEDGILLLNPGTCRGLTPSCLRLEVVDGILYPTKINL